MVWLPIKLVTKKVIQIVTEQFIREGKLNISAVLSHNLISQYKKMLKLTTNFFNMNISNKLDLQKIVTNHLS